MTLDFPFLHSPPRLQAVTRARQALPVTTMPMDSIARMVARILGTPMAAVTLVGEGSEELLGMYGMPEPLASTRRVPMEYSLCAYVVCAGEALTVGDVLADDDLWNHPAILDFGVRSFAGVPLCDAGGHVVAAITVFDVEPRSWSAENLATLAHVAEMVGPIPVADSQAALVAALAPVAADRPVDLATENGVLRSFLTAALDCVQVGVAAFDNDQRPLLLNRALRNLCGEPGTSGYPHLHHPDGTAVRADELVVTRALTGETVRDTEVFLGQPRRPDRHLLANGQPIRAGNGDQLGAVCTVLDVTRQLRSERIRDCELSVARRLNACSSLKQAAPAVVEMIGTTLDWAYVALWIIDDVTGVLHPAATWRVFDPGDPPRADLWPDHVGRDDPGVLGRAWRTGEPVWVHGELADPAAAWTSTGVEDCLAVPVRNGAVDGLLVGLSQTDEPDESSVVGLFTDVARQVGHFLARLDAAEMGRQLTRAKDDYLALVGHEMRTPLTSIISYSTLLAEDHELGEDLSGIVAAITRNAGALKLIIDDLLELAGLDSGRLRLNVSQVDVIEVADAAIAAAPSHAAVRMREDRPAMLLLDADPRRLREILDELIANAVKYSVDGAVVDLSVHDHRDDDVVEIVVADGGIGIPADERAMLFTRHFRASNARHSTVTGTGLGLVFVRTLVQAHGGTVMLDPNHQPGTRMVVRLPRHHSTTRPTPAAGP